MLLPHTIHQKDKSRNLTISRSSIAISDSSGGELMTAMEAKNVAETSLVLREDRGAVSVVTLNRPEARNPLSLELIEKLHGTITMLGSIEPVRAIVITGAGTAFSSGHDLKELTSHRNDSDRGLAETRHRRGQRHRHGGGLPACRQL